MALKSEPRYPVVELSRSLTSSDARNKGSKIAFKTRSEVEVLDDGYRWRKYGKKMVKNSPNPRYARTYGMQMQPKPSRADMHFDSLL